jgi:hypothetical protein
MQIPFRHKKDKIVIYVKYRSTKHEQLSNNSAWECLLKLTDSQKNKLDHDVEQKQILRSRNSIDELFKRGGAGILRKLKGHFQIIDNILDSTPEQIAELTGITLHKASGIYNSALAYVKTDV